MTKTGVITIKSKKLDTARNIVKLVFILVYKGKEQ